MLENTHTRTTKVIISLDAAVFVVVVVAVAFRRWRINNNFARRLLTIAKHVAEPMARSDGRVWLITAIKHCRSKARMFHINHVDASRRRRRLIAGQYYARMRVNTSDEQEATLFFDRFRFVYSHIRLRPTCLTDGQIE